MQQPFTYIIQTVLYWHWDNDRISSPTLNSSPPTGQSGRHFADDIFRYIIMNEKFVFW